MTPRLFLSLSPVLGLLVLHLLSVGSTTPTIVDKRTITDVDKCTKELCTGNTTCDWALLWTNQSLCFLLKCPTIDDCRNATVQDLLATPFPIDTHPTRTSTVVQTEDPKALNLQPNLGSQDSVSQSQEISAEPKQTNETVDNPQLTLASDNNTSDSEQLKPTMTTIAKPTADVTEKVSLTTSATATSTAPPSPATNSTTAPPLKTTTKVTALTSIVSTLPSASTISTPKLKANSTQTSPTPTTTTSTTTTTTPPAPTTLTTLPQTISSSTSTPPPQLPVTTQTITITAETAPPPTTPKILTPPSASEKPTAFPTSPEAVTKGSAGSTNKTIVGITVGPFSVRLVDTSSLLAVLLFGLLFFVVTVVLFLTQAYESYRRKDYTQVDYLINGMYSDSGV